MWFSLAQGQTCMGTKSVNVLWDDLLPTGSFLMQTTFLRDDYQLFFFKIKWLFLKLFLYSIFLNCQLKIVQWFLHELPPLALALPMSFSHCRQLSSLLFFFFQENLSCKNLQFVLNSTVYFLSNVELPEGGEIGRKTKWKR